MSKSLLGVLGIMICGCSSSKVRELERCPAEEVLEMRHAPFTGSFHMTSCRPECVIEGVRRSAIPRTAYYSGLTLDLTINGKATDADELYEWYCRQKTVFVYFWIERDGRHVIVVKLEFVGVDP